MSDTPITPSTPGARVLYMYPLAHNARAWAAHPSESHKYNNFLAERLDAFGDNYADDYSGDTESPSGYFALFGFDATEDDALKPGNHACAWAILTTNNDGFVHATMYDTRNDAKIEYARLAKLYSEWHGDNE